MALFVGMKKIGYDSHHDYDKTTTTMTKKELIDHLSKQHALTKLLSAKVVDSLFEAIGQSMAKKEDTLIVGFGTFSSKARAERQGRNPNTGEPLTIAATTVPTFKPASKLKERISQGAV